MLIAGLIAAAVLGEIARRALERSGEFALQTGNTAVGAGIVLDNHGGFSHAGRRILLGLDGRYTDITYTDVVGGEREKLGRHIFTAHRTHLILMPDKGAAEDVFLIEHQGGFYWVHEADQKRVTEPGEFRLRQVSLRGKP